MRFAFGEKQACKSYRKGSWPLLDLMVEQG
jgi:hypothetical protein